MIAVMSPPSGILFVFVAFYAADRAKKHLLQTGPRYLPGEYRRAAQCPNIARDIDGRFFAGYGNRIC
jgi:hypothetical protein